MGINIRRSYRNTTPSNTILAKFSSNSEQEHGDLILQVSNDLVMVKRRESVSSWWSPEMNLRVEAEGEGSRLYETIGPNAATFTLAMFFIIFGVVLFMVAATWLIVQLQLGESSALSLFGSVLSLITVFAAFAILAYGRVKAKEQVLEMRQFAGRIISS